MAQPPGGAPRPWLETVRPWQLILVAAVLRAALVAFAEYQDSHYDVKYTDIDYVVFTDAARFVASGGSPYQRSTYRYSPLLAYLLLPNIWLHPLWGKVLFSLGDLVVAGLISLLLARTGAARGARALALLVWLFNPYTATISTRGSCDVLSVLLLLLLLLGLLHGRTAAAGVVYGLAVHFRIYPVIYGPAVGMFLLRRQHRLQQQQQLDASAGAGVGGPGLGGADAGGRYGAGVRDEGEGVGGDGEQARGAASRPAAAGRGAGGRVLRALALLQPSAVFGCAAAGTFLLLGVGFYRLYGAEFVHETFLHHVTRKDPRHNFSPYYYPIYLSYGAAAHATGGSGSSTGGAGGSSAWGYEAGGASSSAGWGGGSEAGEAGAGAVSSGPLAAAAAALLRALPLAEPWRLAAVPQAVLLLAVALRYHADLPACWLLQTLAFVAFNKVVTAQYFVWYLSLLPLALPALAAATAPSAATATSTSRQGAAEERAVRGAAMGRGRGGGAGRAASGRGPRVSRAALAAGGVLWVAAQLHWLAWAYQLEMQGRPVHMGVWAAGLVFLAANTALLGLLLRALVPCAGATFMDASLGLLRARSRGEAQYARGKALKGD